MPPGSLIPIMIKEIFSTAYRKGEEAIRKDEAFDAKIVWIGITVAVSVSFIHYWGDCNFMIALLHQLGMDRLSERLQDAVTIHPHAKLIRLLYWVGTVIFFYLVPPVLLIKLKFKEQLSDYGLSFQNAFRDYKVYVLMLLVMLPLVWYFSRTHSFQQRYPFYDLQAGEPVFPDLLIWELAYFIQFFALEFFFRGFMVHGTKQKFGYYSVVVMTIPYCMIHFGKPMPETLAAIVAGLVLGTLSLKSRSIWLGVAIHYSVAITMDLFSLHQKGIL